MAKFDEDLCLALGAAAAGGFAIGHMVVPNRMSKLLYVDQVPPPAMRRTGVIAAGAAASCALIASGTDRTMKKNMLKVAGAAYLADSVSYLIGWRNKTQPEKSALVHTGVAAALAAVSFAGAFKQ